MATFIMLTPPGQAPEVITVYDSVSLSQSMTDRAGSFSISLPVLKSVDITRFVVGTDVFITQESHNFRGYVTNPPVKINGPIKTVVLEGADYSAKTQKIIVTESYASQKISDIVADLFTKYLPWATSNIQTCDIEISINIPDLFLWDVLENLCTISSFQWNIDYTLQFNFFASTISTNPNTITENSYHQGTANFVRDASKLVNKLWVKGSTALSLPISETKTLSASPIQLLYKPHDISITVGGVAKTIGIQNIDAVGTKDFLLNYNEKVIIPDLVTTGTAVITYKYGYPVKVLLVDDISIDKYGQYEDILNVSTGDSALATQMGINYIAKHSNPVLIGSCEPFAGDYNPGELISVDIPVLDINESLVIKSVTYDSYPLKPVSIKIDLENTTGDLTNILKQFQKRLEKLESLNTQNDNEIVQQYRTYSDSIVYPKLQDDGVVFSVHDYMKCGTQRAGGWYV